MRRFALAFFAFLVCLPAQIATSIERHGHRWTFAAPTQVGQFANGDPFVVGVTTIVAILPAPGMVGGFAGNGSVINPRFTGNQGWDDGGQLPYDATQNAALRLPNLVLQPGDSLVSCKSGTGFSQIESAAVLTCLAERPAVSCFRPPYSGPKKPTALYPTTLLRPENLVRVCAPSFAADLPALTARFERLWLDGQSGWAGEYLHPEAYMPPYYREFNAVFGSMLYALAADVPVAEKLGGAVAVTQWGIDVAWNVRNGWFGDGGGHGSGRKAPIVFAGLMGIDDCQDINAVCRTVPRGDSRLIFAEDDQMWFVTQADVARGIGYTAADIGMPEWGNNHYTWPQNDNASWDGNPYRLCCHSNAWHGQFLVLRAMGGMRSWDWPAAFAYHDRYVQECFARGEADWIKSWGGIAYFDEYRRLHKSDLRGTVTVGIAEVGRPQLLAATPPHQGQAWTVHVSGKPGMFGILTRSRRTALRPSRRWGPFETQGLVFVDVQDFQASVTFTIGTDGKVAVQIPPALDVAGTTYTLQAVVLEPAGLMPTNGAEVTILPPM